MFSKRQIITIAFRNWKGEPLGIIANDYDTTIDVLEQLQEDNKAYIESLETEFQSAELQRLSSDSDRKARHGIVFSAYLASRNRSKLPRAVIEYTENAPHTQKLIASTTEAEDAIKAFEEDFGITLL